jgi:hypothetical protein
MTPAQIGKFLFALGLMIALVGLFLWRFPSFFAWFGKLPGDISIKYENIRFYFPLTSLVLVQCVIWIAIRLWGWIWR